jgi:hypothetical protein
MNVAALEDWCAPMCFALYRFFGVCPELGQRPGGFAGKVARNLFLRGFPKLASNLHSMIIDCVEVLIIARFRATLAPEWQ